MSPHSDSCLYQVELKNVSPILFFNLTLRSVALCSLGCLFLLLFQKMNRRLHLSKTKHSKFNESGQLAAFYLFSFIWGCSILTAVPASETKRCIVSACIRPHLMQCLSFSRRRTLQQILLSYGRVTHILAWCK